MNIFLQDILRKMNDKISNFNVTHVPLNISPMKHTLHAQATLHVNVSNVERSYMLGTCMLHVACLLIPESRQTPVQ